MIQCASRMKCWADARFDSERVATKDAKIKMIDSLNKESWKSHAMQQEQYAKAGA